MNDRAPLIRFSAADLGYQGRPVLTGVDFAVERGSFVGIFGPNGSGKTTILRTVLGLLAPIEGAVVFPASPRRTLRLGYVPQKERLDPIYPLSAYEVAAMGTYRQVDLFRVFRKTDRSRHIRECLKTCGALELGSRRYSDLSGGQRQRVLIARALAAEPELLALDEPMAGIDIATQQGLLELLQGLKASAALTVLMVSHRIQVEKDLFTHITWVDAGKAVFAPAAELLARGPMTKVFRSEL